MDTDITKYLLYYLCMCLAISFFFPTAILGEGETSILGIFNVGINSTTGRVDITGSGFANSQLNDQADASSTEQGLFQRGINIVTNFFQFIVDGLGNILEVLRILFAFIFSPFIFVLNPQLLGNAPFYVKMIFAIPLVFLCYMGFIKFIGGRN